MHDALSIAPYLLDLGQLNIFICASVSSFVKRIKNINVEIKSDGIYSILYLYKMLVAILTLFYVLWLLRI